ncbi:tetratricopeptide repeat protein [Granulosicoccaceae sp. 1_MG-2023]|nr:tetratricopeptide repeat protein [Granulosicoccaceae sp. 1_MG-2023]
MSEYETEEQQVEAIKSWWSENGRSVLFGVVLGVAVIGGWRGFAAYKDGRAQDAAGIYGEFVEAAGAADLDKVASLAQQLRDDYSGLTFPVMASLAEAGLLVSEKGDLATAAERLDWALNNASLEEMKTIAALRLARVRLAQGEHQAALSALPESASPAFAGLTAEIRGDIELAMGDQAKARASYEEARTLGGEVVNPAVLDMKIGDLALPESEKEEG